MATPDIHGYKATDAREIYWYGYAGNQGQGQTVRTYQGVLPKMFFVQCGRNSLGEGPAIDYLKEILDTGFFAAPFQWSDAFPNLDDGKTGVFVGTGINPEPLASYLSRTQTSVILYDASFGFYCAANATGLHHPCGTARNNPGAGEFVGNQTDCPSEENPTKDIGLLWRYEPNPTGASGVFAYRPHAPFSKNYGELTHFVLSIAGGATGWEAMNRVHWNDPSNTLGLASYNYLTTGGLNCKIVGWWSDWEDVYVPFSDVVCIVDSQNGITGTESTMRRLVECDDRVDYPASTGWDKDLYYKLQELCTRTFEARARGVEKIAQTWPYFDPNYTIIYDAQSYKNEFLKYELGCYQAYGRPKNVMQPYAWYTFSGSYVLIGREDDYNLVAMQYVEVGREVVRAFYKNCHNFAIMWAPNVNFYCGNRSNPTYGYSLTIAQSIGLLKECMALGTIYLTAYNESYVNDLILWTMLIAYDEMQPYHEFIKYGNNYLPPPDIMRHQRARYNLDSGSPHTSTIYDIKFSPITYKLATVSVDKTCKIWDYSTHHLTTTITTSTNNQYPVSVAWNSDESYLAVGQSYYTSQLDVIKIYNTSNWSLFRTITDSVSASDLVFVGSELAVVSAGNIKIYTVATGQLARTLTFDLVTYATELALSPDGEYLAAAGSTKTVIWNTSTWTEDYSFSHSNTVASIQFSSNSKQMLVSTSDQVEIWEVDTESIVKTIDVTASMDAAFNSDSTLVAVGTSSSTLKIYNVVPATPVLIVSIPTYLTNWEHHNQSTYARSVAFSYDDSFVAAGMNSYFTYCYDPETGTKVKGFTGYDFVEFDYWISSPYWGKDYYGNTIPENYWISCRILGEQMLFFGLNDGSTTTTIDIRSPANTKVSVEVSPTGSVTIV